MKQQFLFRFGPYKTQNFLFFVEFVHRLANRMVSVFPSPSDLVVCRVMEVGAKVFEPVKQRAIERVSRKRLSQVEVSHLNDSEFVEKPDIMKIALTPIKHEEMVTLQFQLILRIVYAAADFVAVLIPDFVL